MTKLVYLSLTLIIWFLSKLLSKHVLKNAIPPVMITVAVIIFVIIQNEISVAEYQSNTWIIHYLLGPATVMLAIPLYKEIETLKKYFKQIVIGITLSATLSLVLTYLLSLIVGLSDELIRSYLAHSVTTPIGIEITKLLSGNQSITVASIILSGLLGALISVPIFKLLKIKSPIAKGLAIGSTSHAIGTTKALELGEVEGALSSLAIPLTAIVTAFICSLIVI
jgi:putative effector of murein hydrolase